MRDSNRKLVNWLRCTLAILLLCAQGVSLAHEIDHPLSADSEFCATHSIGGGLQHLATAHHEAPVERSDPHVLAPASNPVSIDAEHRGPSARAPPTHS